MDAVEALLSGPRARDAHILRVAMAPPWAIRVVDRAPLALVAVLAGSMVLRPDDGPSHHLAVGDVALVRGPVPYEIADAEATPPRVLVHPDNRCETLDGTPLVDEMRLGVRTWGDAADAASQLLVGIYDSAGAVSRRLLDALPTVLVQRAAADDGIVGLMVEEVARDAPGQATLLDRLLDALVVTVLRGALGRDDALAPAWYAADADPVVGPALRAIHHRPGERWTVEGLARTAGVSRAAMARRFADLVGEPPISYLTTWRLDLAADLLAAPRLALAAIAARVGYASAFALSEAFVRERGVRPSEHRRTLLAEGAGSAD